MHNYEIVDLEHRVWGSAGRAIAERLDWNGHVVEQIVKVCMAKFGRAQMHKADKLLQASIREAYNLAMAELPHDAAPFTETEKTGVLHGCVTSPSDHMTMHQEIAFARFGKKVYEVSEDLATELDNTELKGVIGDDLRLPFPSLYFVAPECLDFKMFTRQHDEQPLDGIYISEIEDIDSFHFTVSEELKHKDDLRVWMMTFVSRKVQDVFSNANAAVFALPLILCDSGTIEESIELTLKHSINSPHHHKMREAWPRIFKFVMNAIIYATNNEAPEHSECNPEAMMLWNKIASMPASKKRTGLENKAKLLSSKRYVLRIDRSYPQSKNGNPGTGSPLSVKVRVSGHWRRQVCGPGRVDRKLIWIKPFWKGVANAETSQSNVHVLA